MARTVVPPGVVNLTGWSCVYFGDGRTDAATAYKRVCVLPTPPSLQALHQPRVSVGPTSVRLRTLVQRQLSRFSSGRLWRPERDRCTAATSIGLVSAQPKLVWQNVSPPIYREPDVRKYRRFGSCKLDATSWMIPPLTSANRRVRVARGVRPIRFAISAVVRPSPGESAATMARSVSSKRCDPGAELLRRITRKRVLISCSSGSSSPAS